MPKLVLDGDVKMSGSETALEYQKDSLYPNASIKPDSFEEHEVTEHTSKYPSGTITKREETDPNTGETTVEVEVTEDEDYDEENDINPGKTHTEEAKELKEKAKNVSEKLKDSINPRIIEDRKEKLGDINKEFNRLVGKDEEGKFSDTLVGTGKIKDTGSDKRFSVTGSQDTRAVPDTSSSDIKKSLGNLKLLVIPLLILIGFLGLRGD